LKRKVIATLVLIVALISSTSVNVHTVFSQGKPLYNGEKPLLYVDPATIEGLSPSQEFNISVKIENITGFYGFDIKFRWDPAILDYVDHIAKAPVEDYPDGVLHKQVLTVKDEVNAAAGTYWLAKSSMLPAPSFNGSGIIFEMTFHVKAVGRCLLEFEESDLASPLPPPENEIPHDVQDGFFTNYVASPATIYVSPQKIVNAELEPCKNFTIHVYLEDIIDFKGFQFWLGYATEVLDVSEVTVNPIFPTPVEIVVDELGGQAKINASLLTSVSVNLELASITFHVTAEGESILDLHDVTLIDDWNEAIPYNEPGDGYFSNLLKGTLSVYPEEIINPTLTPGSQFTIDIKLEGVVDLYGYEFCLDYDTTILTSLGAIIIPPNNDTNFNTEISLVDSAGYIQINVTYHPPAEPISILSATTIVTIHFQVENYGCTILDLRDTGLVDPYGTLIAHDVVDGYFCTLIADVAIVNIEASTNATYPGRLVNVTVIAANVGNLTASFNVTAYYDGNPIGTQAVFDLPPGANITLIFSWDTTGLQPCSNYTMKAEASHVPYEFNFANNIYINGWVKIKMIGDINGDGIIDIYDIVILVSLYGLQEGDPGWNPDGDVAPVFGIIDIYDVVTIASKYGEHC
jgi:hypothetical protein